MAITIELSSYYITMSIYSSITLLLSLIFLLICCVCHPKSKRFNKTKNFIISTATDNDNDDDDVIDVQQQSISTERSKLNNKIEPLCNKFNSPINDNKQISINRALPDIPQNNININDDNNEQSNQLMNNSSIMIDNNENNTNNDNKIVENHAYARIRNHHNLITDSSTENDETDDYSDPNTMINIKQNQIRNSYHNTPSNHSNQQQQLNDDNDDNYELPMNLNDNIVVIMEPSIRIVNSSLNNNQQNDQAAIVKQEISYNTISVREPLAKVLAERDLNDQNIEHHYNEVDDDDNPPTQNNPNDVHEQEEKLSSFYEEINNGSGDGSVTYSKIEEPPSAMMRIMMDQPSTSTSYQLQPNFSELNSNIISPPLYALVEKKKNKKHVNNRTNNEDLIDQNLYTKVIKPKKEIQTAVAPSASTSAARPPTQRYSSSSPPPLPPIPPCKEQQQQTNTIFIDDQNLNDEKDPGYETVYNNDIEHNRLNQSSDHDQQQMQPDQIDYGYEAIANESAYEIVHQQQSSHHNMITIDSDQIENGYETIKNAYYDDLNDYEQSDPNYEIISNIKSTISTSNTTNTITTSVTSSSSSSVSNKTTIIINNDQSSSIIMSNDNNNDNDDNRRTYSSNHDDNFIIIEHL